MPDLNDLLTRFDPTRGTMESGPRVERRLSDLRGIFADADAFERALADDDPIVYSVQAIDSADGEGDLHYGIGSIAPGRIGGEYYMTKGHLHAWRPAAEVYIGLGGTGLMLLEDEQTGRSALHPLMRNGIVYVPGGTAHRTINTGSEPLIYLGVYPARAGHDYGTIAERNFRLVVVEENGMPQAVERSEYLRRIGR